MKETPTRLYTLEDYIEVIEAFNKTRPDMNPVRGYNHQMIDILDDLCPLAGKNLLDVGCSPHGYALERALQKRVSAYVGIGLAVAEEVEVRHQSAVGKLLKMNAEELAFESETFTVIISLSTFEHFFNGPQVLREMHRVLQLGGSVLLNFQPVWTCSYGHHLHHFESVASLIPPWAHLLWTEESMRRALQGRWPEDAPISLDEAINWIYASSEINRLDVVTLRSMFLTSDFVIEWLTPLVEDEFNNKLLIANYLSKILPYSAEDLMTIGFSVFLHK